MRNEPTLVSVVMIFLNAGRYIEEAIGSVRAQTYGRWELLLVDDGSTDGSTAIARRHAAADPGRVRYLEHPDHANRGMSASRNLGLRHARGGLVAFLDADDVWLPHKLERQVATLHAQPEAGMVCNPTLWWSSWTGDPRDADRDAPRELWLLPDTLYPPRDLLIRLLRGQARTPATCSVLLRREAVEAVGGFVESFRGMYEDQAFFAKIYHRFSTYVTAEPLDLYRQHPASHCHVSAQAGSDAPASPRRTHQAFLEWLSRHLDEAGERDPEVARALRQALWPYRHPRLDLLRKLPGDVAQSGVRGVARRLARPVVRRIRGTR